MPKIKIGIDLGNVEQPVKHSRSTTIYTSKWPRYIIIYVKCKYMEIWKANFILIFLSQRKNSTIMFLPPNFLKIMGGCSI